MHAVCSSLPLSRSGARVPRSSRAPPADAPATSLAAPVGSSRPSKPRRRSLHLFSRRLGRASDSSDNGLGVGIGAGRCGVGRAVLHAENGRQAWTGRSARRGISCPAAWQTPWDGHRRGGKEIGGVMQRGNSGLQRWVRERRALQQHLVFLGLPCLGADRNLLIASTVPHRRVA